MILLECHEQKGESYLWLTLMERLLLTPTQRKPPSATEKLSTAPLQVSPENMLTEAEPRAWSLSARVSSISASGTRGEGVARARVAMEARMMVLMENCILAVGKLVSKRGLKMVEMVGEVVGMLRKCVLVRISFWTI